MKHQEKLSKLTNIYFIHLAISENSILNQEEGNK